LPETWKTHQCSCWRRSTSARGNESVPSLRGSCSTLPASPSSEIRTNTFFSGGDGSNMPESGVVCFLPHSCLLLLFSRGSDEGENRRENAVKEISKKRGKTSSSLTNEKKKRKCKQREKTRFPAVLPPLYSLLSQVLVSPFIVSGHSRVGFFSSFFLLLFPLLFVSCCQSFFVSKTTQKCCSIRLRKAKAQKPSFEHPT